jgi:hypothetical protein
MDETTDPRRRPDAADPATSPAVTPESPGIPGIESYPLEARPDESPLGADPPPPHPPCPDCGAPRRLIEPVCLQCGHGFPAGSEAGEHPEGDEPPAGPESDEDRDPTLEPLVRPWPGGDQLAWIAAGVVLLGLFAGGLAGTSGLPPALVGDADTVSLPVQVAGAVRLVAAAILWALAAWGVCLGYAWGQDRAVGGRIALGGRMLLAAAVSRLPILLPVAGSLSAFVVEGTLVMALLILGMRASLRVGWAAAAGLAVVGSFAVASAAMLGHVLAWILA